MKLKAPLKIACIISLSVAAYGCGFQSYLPKRVETAQIADQLAQKSPDAPEFQSYLIAQNYPQSELPIKSWGAAELTYSALFFHPDLNVARANWRAAQAREITAAQRKDFGVSASAENHSKSQDSSPWTYGLGIDVPIVTAGKREAQIAQAASLSEAARIEIAKSAWMVRSRVIKSLLAYQFSVEQTKSLENEVALRKSIVDMLTKRLEAGMASNIELSNARIALQKAEQNAIAESLKTPALKAALAADSGLDISSLNKLSLNQFSYQTTPLSEANNVEEYAKQNRLDMRAALARYNAAEAKLKLEIAKQYPDIVASPTKTLDQGDQIWSLGFSSLVTLFTKNRGGIAEAKTARELELAKITALQAQINSEINQAKATYLAANESKVKAKNLVISQQVRTTQTERQFNAGLTDRLELTSQKLENLIAEQNLLSTTYQAHLSASALEDAVQRPLDGTTKNTKEISDETSSRSISP